jgi:hypothetical protein
MEAVSSTGGISKMAENEWMKNEQLGAVTGLPTREHWKVSKTLHYPGRFLGFYTAAVAWCAQGPQANSLATNCVICAANSIIPCAMAHQLCYWDPRSHDIGRLGFP